MTLRLELFETDPGYFTVILGDKFADHLGRDEALAVVAGALFCNMQAPPFLHTYEQWSAWRQHYGTPGRQPFKPAGLLTYRQQGRLS